MIAPRKRCGVLMTVVNECLAESRSRHAGVARQL